MTNKYYDREPKRAAEFIKPPNILKAKVGGGGLSEAVLKRAQEVLEHHANNFEPLGEVYLATLMKGIAIAKSSSDEGEQEYAISCMIYPAMQLKANGGMFGYPLVTEVADSLIHFLEVIEESDPGVIEIVLAYHTALSAIISQRITHSTHDTARDLQKALRDACDRYFRLNPTKVNLLEFD